MVGILEQFSDIYAVMAIREAIRAGFTKMYKLFTNVFR